MLFRSINTIIIGFVLVTLILMFFMGTTNAFFVAMSVPIPPTVMVNAPVAAPSQPIVRMPILNSVPVSVDPFIMSTTTPSQGGNNLGPPQPATFAPSFEPAEIQGVPPSFARGSPSLGIVPLAPIPPTVMVNSPASSPSQPIVSMPTSNSVPIHADPFIMSTRTPSKNWVSLCEIGRAHV